MCFLYKTAQGVGYRDPYESKMLQFFSWDQMGDTDHLRLQCNVKKDYWEGEGPGDSQAELTGKRSKGSGETAIVVCFWILPVSAYISSLLYNGLSHISHAKPFLVSPKWLSGVNHIYGSCPSLHSLALKSGKF